MFINLNKAIEQKQVCVDNALPYVKNSRHIVFRLGNKFALQGSSEMSVPCNELPTMQIEEVSEAIVIHAGQSILVETHERIYSKFMIHPVLHDFYGVYGVNLTWPRLLEGGIGLANGGVAPQPLIFNLFVPRLTVFKAGTPLVRLYFQTENKSPRNIHAYPRSLESLKSVMERDGEIFNELSLNKNENDTGKDAPKEKITKAGGAYSH